MSLTRIFSLCGALLLAVAVSASAAEPNAIVPSSNGPSAAGLWIDDSRRGALVITPCGAELCGSIAWMKDPRDPKTGKIKLDIHNPDPAARGNPICGLRILWGFKPDGPDRWNDGTVYDPESGNTYSAEAWVEPDGSLRLHGYIFIPLLGRSKSFFRPTQALDSCPPPP